MWSQERAITDIVCLATGFEGIGRIPRISQAENDASLGNKAYATLPSAVCRDAKRRCLGYFRTHEIEDGKRPPPVFLESQVGRYEQAHDILSEQTHLDG